MDFLRQVISNEVARPTQIPSGLSLFKAEIAGIAGRFARLTVADKQINGAIDCAWNCDGSATSSTDSTR